jgi:diguanylate cyclase (GGDEF)-like protein
MKVDGGRQASFRDQCSLHALSAHLFDGTTDSNFERHTWLASKALGTPLALISLVDEQRQFTKTCLGPRESRAVACHVPLFDAFCSQVVSSESPVMVDDTRAHPLAARHPEIRELGALAYAGVPLCSVDGHTLGAFSVIDIKPRQWSDDDVRMLRELAATVMIEIELRAVAGALSAEEEHWLAGGARSGDAQPSQERLSRVVDALRNFAVIDELTGLHNRRGFMALAGHQLKLAERNASSLVLFFADIDGLSRINDAFGRGAGDDALRKTAELLRGTFRDSDVLTRLSGDEFAVLACNATMPDADHFAARLQAALELHNAGAERRFVLALSTGAVGYDPCNPEPLEILLLRADAARHADKQRRSASGLKVR